MFHWLGFCFDEREEGLTHDYAPTLIGDEA